MGAPHERVLQAQGDLPPPASEEEAVKQMLAVQAQLLEVARAEILRQDERYVAAYLRRREVDTEGPDPRFAFEPGQPVLVK